jgi:hypothetical protein
VLVAAASAISGWSAILSAIAAATFGIILRRMRHAPAIVRRMRPHFLLGYLALSFSLAHVVFAMGLMRETSTTGLRFASAALIALCAQTFIGASLADPGGYRGTLRAWHYAIIAILVVTIAAHVIANGALAL